MSQIIRLIDRTRTVQDWKCPRSRYWGYEYQGRGLTKSGTSLELFIGIVTHDAMAAIATLTKEGKEVPIDEIARAAFCQVHEEIIRAAGDVVLPETHDFAQEQGTLIEGMLRGFYKHVWPRLMADYKIVAIEQEMEYNLEKCSSCGGYGAGSKPGYDDYCEPCKGTGNGRFIFMSKPDLIVENSEGDLIYLEYKTTSSKKENWINSWETAVQLHSSILATEQTLGKRPSYVQIVGLYKGYESYGKQSSPFCYAYKKSGNPPFTQDQIAYEFKAGFKRSATWDLPGGVKAWVEAMPDLILSNQFPMTPPIFVNEELVGSFFKQRLTREQEIAKALQSGMETNMLDEVFPQRFDQCVPSFGWSCPYKRLCFSKTEDPLSEGFEMRSPHHERELEQLSNRDKV